MNLNLKIEGGERENSELVPNWYLPLTIYQHTLNGIHDYKVTPLVFAESQNHTCKRHMLFGRFLYYLQDT